MPRPNERHDPERFYHCTCIEEEGHHDSRFYHCDCLEGGYDPDEAEKEELREKLATALAERDDARAKAASLAENRLALVRWVITVLDQFQLPPALEVEKERLRATLNEPPFNETKEQ